jgi:hypothetical protein
MNFYYSYSKILNTYFLILYSYYNLIELVFRISINLILKNLFINIMLNIIFPVIYHQCLLYCYQLSIIQI